MNIKRWEARIAPLAAGIGIVLLAVWVRSPSLPYAADWRRASASSESRGTPDADARRRARSIESLREGIAQAERQLRLNASRALMAPSSQGPAFEFLQALSVDQGSAVVLFNDGIPVAWTGKFRTDPRVVADGASVTFSPFYTALNIAAVGGTRRAVATALIHAEAPANQLGRSLDSLIVERDQVQSFAYGRPSDEAAGELVRDSTGAPLLRVDATPVPLETVRFNRVAALQARGSVVLGLALLAFLAVSWTDRRRLGARIFALATTASVIAIVPWNNFSNFARAFDPAYYYLRDGGPLTASAGVLLLVSIVAVLATFALIRARRIDLSRGVATAGSASLIALGALSGLRASAGIAVPPAGVDGLLWLTWEIPLFLIVFSCWLAAWWMGRVARGRSPTVRLATASIVAIASATFAVFAVWQTITRDRLELAERDIAGLQRADGEAANLLRRFGEELAGFDTAGTRADLLKRYAASDLASAELQVSLAAWTGSAERAARLDIAPLVYDSATVSATVRQSLATRLPVIRQSLGVTGRQVILAAPHRSGGATTAVVSPRTRLVARNPFASLLGFPSPGQSNAPYALTLDDVPARTGDPSRHVNWRRIGNEWHGDQWIESSRGPIRAHAEVDLESFPARLVRGSLIVILNVAVAGFLWALGALAEGGFARWVRGRAWRWALSYRGRLTLALFTFFVVPALAFAGWSYQRLRGDDREVRELLVRETLSAAATQSAAAVGNERVGEPLVFLYSRGLLVSSSDPLYEQIAPAGRTLPAPVYESIARGGELTAVWQQTIGTASALWGFRAVTGAMNQPFVLAAPARGDELIIDRRRRDLTMLVLFATAAGGLAALWLSGIAAKALARDLELSRIEVARAERVLAWGEMARQVAHEIKNPLTPIRLGVQHLRRARSDPRVNFDRVLDENVTRILAEIDRLDEIARAFSRYGSAPADLPPPASVDVAAVLRDAVGLERIGVGDVSWTLTGADVSVFAEARNDELREVLLNVFENARLARARHVAIALERGVRTVCVNVADDGSGIARASLPRVFEPHFSTRTTGSGLGLAISRRLLESWGGTIDITSKEGSGTQVIITLQSASA